MRRFASRRRRRGIGREPADADGHVQREDDADEQREREGAFQEDVGEREPIVTVENRERQEQRRVVADHFRPPCFAAGMLRDLKRRRAAHNNPTENRIWRQTSGV